MNFITFVLLFYCLPVINFIVFDPGMKLIIPIVCCLTQQSFQSLDLQFQILNTIMMFTHWKFANRTCIERTTIHMLLHIQYLAHMLTTSELTFHSHVTDQVIDRPWCFDEVGTRYLLAIERTSIVH